MFRKEKAAEIVKSAAKTVADNLNVRKATRTLDRIVEQEAPRPKPGKAELSVVSPSPGGGLACLARLGALLGAAAVAVVLLAGCDRDTTGRPSPPPVTSCEEDQPCWDCHTMGNKVCGPEDVRR
ncbi:hypothetical protein ACFWIW_10990 [Amycolatopsis sp. NPDC058340]|uniref:hypothetical protein n=1 Tax=Amycolatopsis sp. NPDC058340 TaxID=3346453 RepID=UPI00364A9EED